MTGNIETIEELTERYPALKDCAESISAAERIIISSYEKGGTLYTCGNGGSAADADHIVGELMKGFLKKRPLSSEEMQKLSENGASGKFANLQGGLPALSLHSQSSLLTAYLNDAEPSLVFAQAIWALGRSGDVLLAISTSGNSENIINAVIAAKAKNISVIALTGAKACRLDGIADCVIHAGASETYRIQELHLPVYHRICAAVEEHFFKE